MRPLSASHSLVTAGKPRKKAGRGTSTHTPPQVEEGPGVGTGPSSEFLPLCYKTHHRFLPASAPSKGRSHHKSQNSKTSTADRCFLNCSHSPLSYHLYYYLIGTFFYIDSLLFFSKRVLGPSIPPGQFPLFINPA